MAIYPPHAAPHSILKAGNALIFLLVVFFGIFFIVFPTLRMLTAALFISLDNALSRLVRKPGASIGK